jgi:hypothetical protein
MGGVNMQLTMKRWTLLVLAVLIFSIANGNASAQLTIDTTSATDWKISNGTLTMDWDSTTSQLWSMYLASHSSDDLVDTTNCCTNGHPSGLYMDNDGTDMTNGGIGNNGESVTSASYHLDSGHYLDWWASWTGTGSGTEVFTVTEHFILIPNDPTVYTYFVTNHSSTASAGNFGQIQYVYRVNLTDFTNTYEVNQGLNNLGAWELTLPAESDLNSTDPGRAVENAVTDLHGFSLPSNWGREFYTKYDYASYEYLHQAHCEYGSTFGACTIIPSTETFAGGPSKQDLVFTNNLLMGEMESGHDNSALLYVPVQGQNVTRIWGPVGFQFSAGDSPATMYSNAVNTIPAALNVFAGDGVLTGQGYVPNGTSRGTVTIGCNGCGSSSTNTAWAVLGDRAANQQLTNQGYQYWTTLNSSGDATIANVVPGNYRLSAYVLGEWGELRYDGVTVAANSNSSHTNLVFHPENFSPSGDSPVWTIGTPDRSAHEFLHGKNNYGNAGSCSGCDDHQYWGDWNYWSDFSANQGAVDYYATAVGSTPATNNLLKWNYTQWGQFNPGLYDSSNDTTDNYTHLIPSYVAGLPGSSGTNGVTTLVPPWNVYFTTTAAQTAQGGFVDVSIALPCVKATLTASLNGHPLPWSATKNDGDCMVRSGFSGYYQWVVFEWPTSDLETSGNKDTLQLSVNGSEGISYDALRMEVSHTGANPSTTGWHDYEYVNGSTYIAADDAVASNN